MSQEEMNQNIFQEICEYPIPTYDQWKQAVEKSLKGAPFSKLLTKTYEEIILLPMYQQRDIEHLSFPKSLPGEFPYVRGTKKVEGNSQWFIAQEMNHPLSKTVNEWLTNDLQKGVNAIHLVLNERMKIGQKSAPLSLKGTVINNLEDLETTLENIAVTNFPFVIQCGANFTILSLLAAYFEKNNLPLCSLKGYVGMDPLAIAIKEGKLSFTMDDYLDQMAQQITWKEDNKLELKTIFIDSSPYHNGGANAVQELAYMMATGAYYLRELQLRGLSIDEVASSICFSISVGSNLFMELAKIRSAKMLWANIVSAFGGSEENQKLTVHARTSYWTKTVYDPYVNMLRGTVEAFTAAVAGVNSLHVSPFDEAFALPNEFSRRIARNIQLIIQEEALVTKTVDPAGGSWYIEHLTDELASKSWELFQQTEGEGGLLLSLQKGIPQTLVKEVSMKKKADIEKRKLVFVGATMYPNKNETYPSVHDEMFMETREGHLNENLFVAIENSVEQNSQTFLKGATIFPNGISDNRFTIDTIETFRATQSYELLRQYSETKRAAGEGFHVFLTSMGTLADHKLRSDFITSFFETGGFQVEKNNGFVDWKEAVIATVSSNAQIAVLCGKNESYQENALSIVTEVRKQRPDIQLFVAGKQEEELETQLLAAGVTGFIHVGTNCYKLLKQLQGEKEGTVDE